MSAELSIGLPGRRRRKKRALSSCRHLRDSKRPRYAAAMVRFRSTGALWAKRPDPVFFELSGPCRAVRVSVVGGRCQVALLAHNSGFPDCEGAHLSPGTPQAVPSSCDLSSSGSSSGHSISICLPSLNFCFRPISNPEAGFNWLSH